MGFPFPLVDRGDGLAGYPVIVEGIDIEPPVSVADSEDVSVFLV